MKISIITICYNNLEGLQKTAESVWNQTAIKFIEFIVIDGNSSDGTKDYLEKNNARIDCIISEPDKGIYDAQNKGLLIAKGNLVWFMNSGDIIYKNNTVSKIIESYHPDYDIYYGETMYLDTNYRELGLRSTLTKKTLPKVLKFQNFNKGMTIGHQSILVKRTIAPLYELKYKHVADIDWIINCLKIAKKTCKIDSILSGFLIDGHSSKFRMASNKERFWVLQKHYGIIPNIYNHLKIVLKNLFY